jgi:hypothetical protein
MAGFDEPWYSARCIFRLLDVSVPAGQTVYEERIILVRAASFDEATDKADAFATKYAHEYNCEYLRYTDVYHLYEEHVGDGTEVYSLMRTCELDPEGFIRHYFSDGTEHVRDLKTG